MGKYKNTFPVSDITFKQWMEDNHWEQSENYLTKHIYYNRVFVVKAMNIFTLYDKWYSENVDNNFKSKP